ncbi:CENPX protein, partial [Ceuthmochares aereus]|nr:CENPX protein [Ceuthmochares aereus]
SAAALPPQETVGRLLRLHFRDPKTRVNGDAQLLMGEMLKVFVRGERLPGPRAGGKPRAPHPGPALPRVGVSPPQPPVLPAEAAARAARQAQAEDLERVEIEHVEKVLPQLVRPC